MRKAPLPQRIVAEGKLRDCVGPSSDPATACGAECLDKDGQQGGLPRNEAAIGKAVPDADAEAAEMMRAKVALAMEECFQFPEQELLAALWARASGLRASRRAQQAAGRARLARRRQHVADTIPESPCDSKFNSFCSESGSASGAAELAKTRSFG